MRIGHLEHNVVYRRFAKQMRKEQVAIKKTDDVTKYIAIFREENPIGVVGFQKISETHFRLKTAFVIFGMRGKGIYSQLWDARMQEVLSQKPKTLSAYCTTKSLPKYLKEGFEVVSSNKNQITYVKKSIT